MLKIKSVNLNSNITFLPGELDKLAGDATLNLATGAESTVALCKGVFRMSNCGTGVMCSIQAAGKLAATHGYKDVNLSNLSLALTNGKIVREYNVLAGSNTISTGLLNVVSDAASEDISITSVTKATGVINLSASASVDKKVKVTLTLEAVGTCEFTDDNISHKIDIVPDNDAMLIEFTALCNVNSSCGLRPNKVSLLFRGSNSWKVMGKNESDQTVMLSASNEPFDSSYPSPVLVENNGGGGE